MKMLILDMLYHQIFLSEQMLCYYSIVYKWTICITKQSKMLKKPSTVMTKIKKENLINL